MAASAAAAAAAAGVASQGGGGGSSVPVEGPVVAGIEGGGSSWKVILGRISADRRRFEIVDRPEEPFKTQSDPAATLGEINAWLRARRGQFHAVGIASFGPVQLDKGHEKYGFITTTPKEGWENTDVITEIMRGLDPGLPCAFDTDVNAPALAEYLLTGMKDQGKSSCAYITIGTGIGVGLVVNGRTVHGLLHPEGGHISVPRQYGDTYKPDEAAASLKCTDWLEAECFAAKNSIETRYQLAHGESKEVIDIPKTDPVWDSVAHYAAAVCANLVLVVSPERIVLGGGIMTDGKLLPRIRDQTRAYLNEYIKVPELLDPEECNQFICPPHAKGDAGLVGALLLASLELEKKQQQQQQQQQQQPPPQQQQAAGGVTVPAWAAAVGVVAGAALGLVAGAALRRSRL